MKDSRIIRIEQPLSFETLESTIRGEIQGWIQSILDEEVTEFLGRVKSERRKAVDEDGGYRNGHGEREEANHLEWDSRVEASSGAGVGAALREPDTAAV